MLPAIRSGNASLIDRVFSDFDQMWTRPLVEQRSTTSAYYGFRDTGNEYLLEFSLPVNADMEAIRAKVENGVLRVTIPKPVSEKEIDVEVAD